MEEWNCTSANGNISGSVVEVERGSKVFALNNTASTVLFLFWAVDSFKNLYPKTQTLQNIWQMFYSSGGQNTSKSTCP